MDLISPKPSIQFKIPFENLIHQTVITSSCSYIIENIIQSVPPLQHGVRSLGLEHRFELRSNNTMRQGESKFGVVHLLDVRSAAFTCRNDLHLQDLNRAGTSTTRNF